MKSPAAIRVDRAGAKLLSRANPTRVGARREARRRAFPAPLTLATRPSERISGARGRSRARPRASDVLPRLGRGHRADVS